MTAPKNPTGKVYLPIPFVQNPKDPIGYAIITADVPAYCDVGDSDWELRQSIPP